MKKEAFRQHQTIFKAGDQAGKVYLLARGSVGIFLPDNDSKEPNFLIPENEIFGEKNNYHIINESLLYHLCFQKFSSHYYYSRRDNCFQGKKEHKTDLRYFHLKHELKVLFF